MNTLQIKQLSPNATLPTRNFQTDSGLDIYASEDVIVTQFLNGGGEGNEGKRKTRS